MLSVPDTSSIKGYSTNVDLQDWKGNIIDVNVESMSDNDREAFLLQWTTERCGEDGTAFTFDEGWDMIRRFGLNVLSDMLKDFLLNTSGINKKERLGKEYNIFKTLAFAHNYPLRIGDR